MKIQIMLLMLALSCNNNDYEKSIKFKDLLEYEVIEQLGHPLREQIIFVHEESMFREYQSGLYAIRNNLQNDDTVRVKEMHWEYNNKNQIIWFTMEDGEWKEFDNINWSKDIQF